MNVIKVEGKDRGDFFLYALSTCIWCRKTKAFLSESGAAYSYVFVDELEGEEKEKVKEEIKKWNPS
ncbi:MAG: glutaredoxin domain-containing protein, partial [Spirochaetota bacterium]